MKEARCVFRAHYKSTNMSFYNLGEFEVWLPESEAIFLRNDKVGRERVFRMHYPTAREISGTVALEIYERR